MAKVIVKNVYKIYPGDKGRDITAVKDVTLEIGDREFVVLVGPSGCGKSTTLRMIAGLEEISKGDIYIGDRRVNDVPPKDRDIAMVFQNYALYPHMSVYDNLAFGLKLRKYPKPEIKKRVPRARLRIIGRNAAPVTVGFRLLQRARLSRRQAVEVAQPPQDNVSVEQEIQRAASHSSARLKLTMSPTILI